MLGDDPALGLHSVLDRGGEFDRGLARAMLELMIRVRRLDERMLAKQRQGRIGFYGTITGQEAVPVAIAHALRASDWVFPALREAPIAWLRGLSLSHYLAQVYGNAYDLQKGRQMPSHQASRAQNHVAWSSCIATQIPQAVGAAMAARILGDDAIVVAFMGDGATSEPDFHAAMTFAARYSPPLVLVCQNNHWAISVPAVEQSASATFAIKARAYGIAAIRVDGNDALAVHEVFTEAAGRARADGGPTFIEAVTYRVGPHSSSDDPRLYRSDDEVARWIALDPIARLESALDFTSRSRVIDEIDREVDRSIRELEACPAPNLDTLFSDVYREPPWHLRQQFEEATKVEPKERREHDE